MAERSLLDLGGKPATVPPPSRSWRTRVLLPAAVLASFAILFGGSIYEAAAPTVVVEASPVVERPSARARAASAPESGAAIVQAAGWIEPSPFPTYVPALTDGVVAEVLVLEGEAVRAGQAVARLVEDDARIAHTRAAARLRQAEAEVQAAQADLTAAEITWNENVERTRAARVAEAAVREASAALQLARAQLKTEEAMRSDALQIFERRRALRESGAVAQTEFASAEAALAAQEARTTAATERIAVLQAQLQRATAEHESAARELELRTEERRSLDAAKGRHARAQADLDAARAELQDAELRLKRTQIVSPADGVVMRRLVEPGSKIHANSDAPFSAHVVHLYDPQKLQVRVDVPLADAAKIGAGQRAEVVAEVLPNRTFRGTVARVTGLADVAKNTLEVKVTLEDPAPELKPDMLARVKFFGTGSLAQAGAAQSSGSALFVPAAALVQDANEQSTWVVSRFDGERGVAVRRTVQPVGDPTEGWMEIASGLRPGDLVVIAPGTSLREGMRIRVRKEGR